MINYLGRVIKGSIDVVKGHLVTLKYLFKKPITVQYPQERLTLPPRFRGVLRLNKDIETGKLKCIACQSCMRICPAEVISITTKRDEKGKRVLDNFEIQMGRCLFCGMCVDVCPVKGKAIVHSNEYELAFSSREEMILSKARLSGEETVTSENEEVSDEQTGS